MTISDEKAAARKAAFTRRKEADRSVSGVACDYLLKALGETQGAVAGYWPIRTEIDPRPVLHALAKTGREICLPVVEGQGVTLSFRRWTPDAKMIDGAYGAAIPADESSVTPAALIVPLAAFTDTGYRLGYGGGFYDRTLEQLGKMAPTTAIGFAFEAQRADTLPLEPTDQRLDMIVTETGIRRF